MALKDRLNFRGKARPAQPEAESREAVTAREREHRREREQRDRDKLQVFDPLLERLRGQIMERLDFLRVGEMSKEDLRRQIRHVVELLIGEMNIEMNESTRALIVESVEDEMLGLGPIQQYLRDPDVSDILVNGAKEVYIERYGKLEKTETNFRDDQHVLQIIERIVSQIGRHIDESSPMVDARLQDGSRVNAIIPPLAIDGPTLSIRRFGVRTIEMKDLLGFGTLTEPMAELLQGIVRARINILISGGTGSGKTTLLNAMSAFIPPDERILTIEDSAELQLLQPHVVRLETRPPNIEGRGTVTQRDLVRNALRMRPDRIILGEVRGDEAMDMMQAMNTGHDGSLTTLHANSTRDALTRLETLVLLAGHQIPDKAIREHVASALEVLVHVSRLSDGTRRVTNISEIVGMEGEVITTQDIFAFQKLGVDDQGKVIGRHIALGVRPHFIERLKASGVHLPTDLFAHPDEEIRR
ncbi:MAG TPA: CpaF family protein [Candidatus Udaeobacter sp.]|nr:CpaF family protein [Candidatus Udaeobacter sp.]